MEIKGYLHLYWGDGKGKTTAAAGLALRALGQRLPTVFLQFLKDGQSGELEPLRRLGAAVLSGEPGMKFVFQMTEAEKAKLKARQDRMLREAVSWHCWCWTKPAPPSRPAPSANPCCGKPSSGARRDGKWC